MRGEVRLVADVARLVPWLLAGWAGRGLLAPLGRVLVVGGRG